MMIQSYSFPHFLLLLLSYQVLPSYGNISRRNNDLKLYTFPTHYSLDLILDPRSPTYEGLVEIDFVATDADNRVIWLHASTETIEIKEVLLNYEHSCNVTSHDEDTDVVTMECPVGSLLEGENTLIIHFNGTFTTDEMSGLYKSTYKENDEDNVLLATQFESVYARKAFPCFDKPDLKATFDIFITHPNDYLVLANTPVVKTFSISSDQTQTQFETTPPMSTYLIAFIVSKFLSSSNKENRKYDYKVFSRPSAKDYTNIASSYGPTLIDLLSNWTGIEYSDLGDTQAYQVAIPDFAAGAMENWGLITYREVDLLDEKDTTPNAAKQRIITTIAHELSHQWFGDYVTLDWWSDTWLNEGFATYFEYFIPDQLKDNLDTMKQFVVNELQPVLQVDAMPSALPLTSNVDSAAEYSSKFDDISYSKGGSIVRMLRNILGETAFREGLHTYLTSYKYNNTNPGKLLNSFPAKSNLVSDLTVEKVMNNWIFKSGFPLVSAELNGSTVILSQERFLLQNSTETEATQWYVPISYTTSAEVDFNISTINWLIPNSTVEIELDDKSWIIFNIQQAGYYRVNYDDTLWDRITKGLKAEKNIFHVLNRAQLIDDAFNIARVGKLSYEIPFHLAEYLSSETEYYPWVSALNAFSFIFGKLNDAEAEKLLQSQILTWISKAFPADSDIGTEHADKLKEVLILNWACKLGQIECIEYSIKAFKTYKTNHTLPDYNRRGLVFCHGFRKSSEPSKDFEFLFNLFKTSKSVIEQNEIISALGCTEDLKLLTSYLSKTIATNSSIRKQDAALVFKAVYTQSEVGINASLDFLEKNLDSISTAYKGMNALPNLILGLANKVISDDQISKLKKIIDDNSDIEDIKIISQRAFETTTANRNWADTYSAHIKKVLQESPNRAVVSKQSLLLHIIVFGMYYLFRHR